MINERKLSDREVDLRNVSIQGLMKNKQALVKKYGRDAEQVMYGIATKQSKQKVQEMNKLKVREMIKDSFSKIVNENDSPQEHEVGDSVNNFSSEEINLIVRALEERLEDVENDRDEFGEDDDDIGKMEALIKKLKGSSLNESYMGEPGDEVMISKSGSRDFVYYVLEKLDGSAQVDMTFDSPTEAVKYATKRGLKVSSKIGYGMKKEDLGESNKEPLTVEKLEGILWDIVNSNKLSNPSNPQEKEKKVKWLKNKISTLKNKKVTEEEDPKPKDDNIEWSQAMSDKIYENIRKKLDESLDLNKEYGVVEKGGSIGGGNKNHVPGKGRLVATFDSPEEAKEYAKSRRKGLSKGERGHYGMGYTTIKINDSLRNFLGESFKPRRIYENKQPLKEITNDGGNYNSSHINRMPENEPGDMFAQQEVRKLFPKGMASFESKELKDRIERHANWTVESRYNFTFLHMQYHKTEEIDGKYYFIHQTQYYNHHMKDWRNPHYTELNIYSSDTPDNNREEKLGTYLVDTDAYIEDLKKLPIAEKRS